MNFENVLSEIIVLVLLILLGFLCCGIQHVLYLPALFVRCYRHAKRSCEDAVESMLNPRFLATVIGFSLFVCKVTLPYVILRPMQMVGDMTIPLALMITGISLAQIPVKELVWPWDIWVTSLIRLTAFPAVLLFILSFVFSNEYLIAVPVIIMGTPTALTAGAFAMTYGCDDQLASKGVVLSNFLSIITMPLVVWAVMRVLTA